jgi:hypothetical protein
MQHACRPREPPGIQVDVTHLFCKLREVPQADVVDNVPATAEKGTLEEETLVSGRHKVATWPLAGLVTCPLPIDAHASSSNKTGSKPQHAQGNVSKYRKATANCPAVGVSANPTYSRSYSVTFRHFAGL